MLKRPIDVTPARWLEVGERRGPKLLNREAFKYQHGYFNSQIREPLYVPLKYCNPYRNPRKPQHASLKVFLGVEDNRPPQTRIPLQ